jgi:ABC-type lipoprotein release transport system permease subunit
MTTLLSGVQPHDPMTFAAVPAVVVMVAISATLVPALRAARLDPLQALKTE